MKHNPNFSEDELEYLEPENLDTQRQFRKPTKASYRDADHGQDPDQDRSQDSDLGAAYSPDTANTGDAADATGPDTAAARPNADNRNTGADTAATTHNAGISDKGTREAEVDTAAAQVPGTAPAAAFPNTEATGRRTAGGGTASQGAAAQGARNGNDAEDKGTTGGPGSRNDDGDTGDTGGVGTAAVAYDPFASEPIEHRGDPGTSAVAFDPFADDDEDDDGSIDPDHLSSLLADLENIRAQRESERDEKTAQEKSAERARKVASA